MKFVRYIREDTLYDSNIDRKFNNLLAEVLTYKKAKEGEVKFRTSTINDPHIQKVIEEISKASGMSVDEITNKILSGVEKVNELAKKAPLLYHTMKDNFVEEEVFKLFQETKAGNGPKFSTRIFYSLINNIKAEIPRFYPLRGEIEKKYLHNIDIVFVGGNEEESKGDVPKINAKQIPTAAATPTGRFIFNVDFMQTLLNYAHTIGLKPKRKIYVSNGGKIPDEYAYIEFLIMHELMHFSKDDFYYQKILHNANPTIINFVGDFRTNYTLTKSGFEPLPVGLYNSKINLDTQKSYVEMYKLVEEEFNKLKKENGKGPGPGPGKGRGGQPGGEGGGGEIEKKIIDDLESRTDNHKPGQEEGKEKDTGNTTIEDIEDHNKKVKKIIEEAKKRPGQLSGKDGTGKGSTSTGNPGRGLGAASVFDPSQVKPTFNWKQLVDLFVKTAKPKPEETYAKPSRRNVSGLDILSKTGAAAIKPGEKLFDPKEAKLGFVFDSSGSMYNMIVTVMSNVINLLKQPTFKNMETISIVFGGQDLIFKTIYGSNKAASVTSINEKPSSYPLSADIVFKTHRGGGTVFTATTASELSLMLKKGYNVILFSDLDILHGENYEHFIGVIKAYPQHMFVVFDSHETYVQFRQKSQFATKNITHF